MTASKVSRALTSVAIFLKHEHARASRKADKYERQIKRYLEEEDRTGKATGDVHAFRLDFYMAAAERKAFMRALKKVQALRKAESES